MLFDFGGTLDADGVTWKERVRRLYGEAGMDVPPERFDPVFHAADDALVGTVPAALPFRDTVRALVTGVSRGLRIDDDALSARVAARFVADAHETARRNRAVLAALRRRYRLGVISNFYGNLATVCAECGLAELFDVVVDSARLGVRKPDARIFQAALTACGVTAPAATFVGDSPTRDMAGARAIGMPHVWLVADPASAPAPCCPRDPVIPSLACLPELLL